MAIKIPFNVNDAKLRQDFLVDCLCPAVITKIRGQSSSVGKMTVQILFEHLIWAFRLSTGKLMLFGKTTAAAP